MHAMVTIYLLCYLKKKRSVKEFYLNVLTLGPVSFPTSQHGVYRLHAMVQVRHIDGEKDEQDVSRLLCMASNKMEVDWGKSCV